MEAGVEALASCEVIEITCQHEIRTLCGLDYRLAGLADPEPRVCVADLTLGDDVAAHLGVGQRRIWRLRRGGEGRMTA
jgi:hypothetical protein